MNIVKIIANVPIHRAMAYSFVIFLVFVLTVIWDINTSLSHVAENSEQIELETTQSAQDVDALTNKVFPAHRLELAVIKFLHEFEYMLIDAERDDIALQTTAETLRSKIVNLPPEATNSLSVENQNLFNETMGIFLDIVDELSQITSAHERYQVLYDSRDSLEQFSPMVDQVRSSIEEQGRNAISLAKSSTQKANAQVAIQNKELQDMIYRNSILLTLLILAYLVTNSGLYWTLSKRLSQVSRYSRKLAAGDFEARIELASSDNIAQVAKDVELMGGILAAQVVKAEINHEESTRRAWTDESMRALYEATRGIAEIHELSKSIAYFFAERFNLVAGKIYYVDEKQLLTVASFGTVDSDKSYSLNEGLPGMTASTGQIKHIEQTGESNLMVESAFLNGQPAHVYLIPIMADGVPILVMELGATSKLSDQQYAFLQQASEHLALSIRAVEQQSKTEAAVQQLQINAELLHKRSDELETAKDVAERASQSKSEFLANMSHEIRTPLNGIIGNTELLLSSSLDQRQHGFTMTIQRSGDALLSIINDILDFSKIEAGKLDLVSIPFDLRALVEDVGEMFSELAHDKNIELLYRLPPTLSVGAMGDPGRLRQILTNLVGNALKFTAKGEVLILVELADGTDYWNFEVRDTGIGISALEQQHIFRAFTQADGSTNRQFGGTGLGLAVSKQLVEMMGGTLSCASIPGEGSTFSFSALLPATELPNTIDPTVASDLNGLHVLLVDDNATNREILENQLGAWDIRCSSASNADEALELLNEAAYTHAPYHLAILDQNMPKTGGAQLAGLIRNNTDFADMAIIMLSSVYQSSINDLDISHSLIKPVRGKDLYQCIHSTTGKQALVSSERQNTARSCLETSAKTPVYVLVVDDSSVNRKLAQNMLEQLGHDVIAVSSGPLALAKLEEKPFDLILMDCQMPGMDGFETTRLIREAEAESEPTGTVPYIAALTANAMTGDRQLCLNAGMDDYLSKPYKQQELISLIDRCLSAQNNGTEPDQPHNLSPSQALTEPALILDPDQLNEIRELDSEDSNLLNQLIALYLESSPAKLEDLNNAVHAKDSNAIFHAAHALKSDSANLGAVELSSCCKRLEELGRSGVIDGIDTLFAELKNHFAAAQNALESERRKAA